MARFTIYNFTLSGTVEFGTTALDRGTIIADIQDVREALNMADAAGEILGFFSTGNYNDEEAKAIARNVSMNQLLFRRR
ncbi:MAG: hypothetical protein MZV63_61115 [Marinilabiliales bacterium]|nr:hypothetical protein [Marinilabiliales bacterium]